MTAPTTLDLAGLLPCPFCGGVDAELMNTHTPSFWVECQGCGASAQGSPFDSRQRSVRYAANPSSPHERDFKGLPVGYKRAAQSAITAWNTRAQLQADADGLARLREALADLLSWFPDKPTEPEWRIPAGSHGADDAVRAAQDALTPLPKGPTP